jgi:hypothetical protein
MCPRGVGAGVGLGDHAGHGGQDSRAKDGEVRLELGDLDALVAGPDDLMHIVRPVLLGYPAPPDESRGADAPTLDPAGELGRT